MASTYPICRNSSSEQGRVGAVDLVPGHPPGPDTGVQGAGKHPGGQRGLGQELDVVGHPDLRAPVGVVGPTARR